MKRALFSFLLFTLSLMAERNGGPYISVGYGDSYIKDSGYYGLDEESSKGYIVCAGAYINKHLSVEVEYIDALQYHSPQRGNVDFSVIDINTQAHYPLYDDKLDLYVKFGAGEVNQNSSGFALVYGAGASWRFDERFALRSGYDYVDFGIDQNGDGSSDVKMHIGFYFVALEVQF